MTHSWQQVESFNVRCCRCGESFGFTAVSHDRKGQIRNPLQRVCFSFPSSNALENVYSMIQHPKDAARPESTVPGANGSVASPPGPGVRAASPPCLIQRQVGIPEIFIWEKSPPPRVLSTHTYSWSHQNQSESQTGVQGSPLMHERGIILQSQAKYLLLPAERKKSLYQ